MATILRKWPKGHRLFDILNNLPEYGVGRVVTRTSWLTKYPDEPSYIRITSVTMDTERWPKLTGGEVWAIPTWRGYSKDGLEVKIAAWHKAEWKLIRKSEEEFCAYEPKEQDFHVVPSSISLPPLLETMMRHKMEKEGNVVEENLKLKLTINKTYVNRAYQLPEL